MCFKLPFLYQIHKPRHARERERAESDNGNRSMHFQPEIDGDFDQMWLIDRREKREKLDEKNERSGEGTHQGEPISGPNREINQCNRPAEEDKDFEEICDRASADGMAAYRKKNRLQDEPRRDRKKIETPAMQKTGAKGQNGADNRDEKTAGGENNKEAIHREGSV